MDGINRVLGRRIHGSLFLSEMLPVAALGMIQSSDSDVLRSPHLLCGWWPLGYLRGGPPGRLAPDVSKWGQRNAKSS